MNMYSELYSTFKQGYSSEGKKHLLKKFYKGLVADKSNVDFIVILLKVFKESSEDLTKIVNIKNLVFYYTQVCFDENKEFLIEEFKERNFNLDYLIFA